MECPDCGGEDGEHGPECQLVTHWDNNGTCEGCGADYRNAHVDPNSVKGA